MTKNFLQSVLSLMAVVLVSVNTWAQVPTNNNNPYDYVGKIHNQIVEEFLNKHSGNDLSTEEVFNITAEIAKNNPEIKSRGFKIEKADYRAFEEAVSDFSNDLKNIVGKMNVSNKGKTRIQTLFNYFITIGTKPTKPTYSEIHNYVIQFEREVIDDASLSEKDKMVILCGTSTARYSSKLWIDRAETNQTVTSDGRRWWGHVIVIGSDIAGGIIGGGKENPGQAATTGSSFSNAADTYLEKQGK